MANVYFTGTNYYLAASANQASDEVIPFPSPGLIAAIGVYTTPSQAQVDTYMTQFGNGENAIDGSQLPNGSGDGDTGMFG